MRLKKWMIRSGVIVSMLAVAPGMTAISAGAAETDMTAVTADTVAADTEVQDNSEWDSKLIVNVSYDSCLNVREEATTDSEILDKLSRGDELTIVEAGDEWTKVALDEDETSYGYVCNDYILTGDEAEAFAAELEDESDIACELVYSASAFKSKGVAKYDGFRWTWYSQNALPGGGLKIPGRHVDENGYVCDEDGYICLASRKLSKGTVVNTPLGKQGKVYDVCKRSDTIDVYTAW